MRGSITIIDHRSAEHTPPLSLSPSRAPPDAAGSVFHPAGKNISQCSKNILIAVYCVDRLG